jgi:hypothetical protein
MNINDILLTWVLNNKQNLVLSYFSEICLNQTSPLPAIVLSLYMIQFYSWLGLDSVHCI